MAKGETDYEIWRTATSWAVNGLDFGTTKFLQIHPVERLATCDTKDSVRRWLARHKWPKNGIAIIPVRR